MLLFGVVLFSLGCRANAEDCRDVASHVIELAQAQGKLGDASADELERTCNEERPTRALIECMLGAQTLAELEGC